MPVKRLLIFILLTTSLGSFVMWRMVHSFLEGTDRVIETVDFRSTSQVRAETVGQAASVETHVKPARSDESTQLLPELYNAQTEHLADFKFTPSRVSEPTTAINARLQLPERCRGTETAENLVKMKFRSKSAIVKGESLMDLESLVSLYRACGEGVFLLSENPLGITDSTTELTRRRFDEMKYFFLQHSISIETVLFPPDYD